LTTLKIAALAPMASASVATTTSVKPGVRTRPRAACLKSLIHVSSIAVTASVARTRNRSGQIGPVESTDFAATCSIEAYF
jgi:hypothetical protein